MVKVMAGRSKGKTGKVLIGESREAPVTVEHANIIKKHTRPNPSEERSGRHSRKGRPDPRFQRDAGLPGLRKAHARGTHDAARRHKERASCRRCNTTFSTKVSSIKENEAGKK